MNSLPSPWTALLCAAAAVLGPAVSAQTFTRIIGSGDPVPGGAIAITAFSTTPALGGGTLAFTEFHSTGGGSLEILWKHSNGSFQRVAATGDVVPSWGREVRTFSRLAVDDDGSVAFLGSSPPSPSTISAIFTDQGGTLRHLLDSNTFIPGVSLARFSTIANVSLRSDGGHVVFSGGGRSGTRSLSGVFSAEAATGTIRTLAIETRNEPGIGTFLSTGACDVRDGRVALEGQVQNGTATLSGIYLANADGTGPITVVVDTSDINPITGMPFSHVGFCEIDEDDVAYFGFASGLGNQGIHSSFAAPIPASVTLPGVGPAGSLEEFRIDRERIVFEATGGSPGFQSLGIFVWSCGNITKLLAPGDGLDGKTVQRASHGDEAMDGDELALLVGFTDGTQAIYVADLSTVDNYGQGLAGELGLEPRIEGFGCPATGSTFRIELRDGPSGLMGGMFFGAAQANIPFLGGTVLVRPDIVTTVTLQPAAPGFPRPWASLGIAIPAAPALVGTPLYVQAHYPDPAAVQGVSMTDGLRFVIE